ncbi:MAG: hypothetical protein M1608_13870, partial [Candidatus Omnitrophica bacterium]|nr:hypothetical protein [Candidatus Omnitrophota bacterium]
MKPKLFLFAFAWLTTAAFTGGQAASYSISLAPGWNLIANQVDGANGNGIRIIIPAAPLGSQLMKYNLATKSFGAIETYTAAAGWLPGTNVLNPGEGIYFSNSLSSTFNLTINGISHTPVLPLNIGPGTVLVARQTNDVATIANILGYNPPNFTIVYRFNPGHGFDPDTLASPNYTIYTLKDGAWTSPPGAPVDIRVGESVWVSTNGSPPTIALQPRSQSVCPRDKVAFTIRATGSVPLTYQWFLNNSAIADATNSNYGIATVEPPDLGTYTIKVTNPFGSTVSSNATLTFANPPAAAGPTNTVAYPGDPVSLTTVPSGEGPFSFAWFKNGVLLSGQVTNVLEFPSVGPSDAGTYCVVVYGFCGSATNCATLKVLPSPCCDNKSWITFDQGRIQARRGHAMAYDSARNRVVLFGGYGPKTLMGDTWEWDGSTWTQVATEGPSARAFTAMAYDSRIHLTVLFGGSDAKSPQNDTWTWDGTQWKRLEVVGPSLRSGHSMAYNSALGVTVLFGGQSPDGAPLGDTWVFDGSRWAQVSTGSTNPEPRMRSAMAYGSSQNQTILFGGFGKDTVLGDTWNWDGKQWTRVANSGPPARAFHALAYDDNCDRIVLFGGGKTSASPMGDTWEWDGKNWAEKKAEGPSPRTDHAMAYDSATVQTILFGGMPTTQLPMADTWAWGINQGPLQIVSVYAVCEDNQIVITFSSPVSSASATNLANYQLTCGSTPISISQILLNEDARIVTLITDLPFPVTSGCTLYVHGVRGLCGNVIRSVQQGLECSREPCGLGSGGTDFWLTFPGNYAPDPTNQPQLKLFIAGAPGTIGAVAMPGLATPFLAGYAIPAAGVATVTLPREADLANANELIEKKGIHITASRRVNVYGHNHIRFTTDSFLGLSTSALGKVYMVLTYQNVFNAVPELSGSQFAMVATQDGTTVTVVPSAKVGAHPAGIPFTVPLMRGQTYQLRNTLSAPADLTGTIIVADQPIAVFGSHQCANLPTSTTFFGNYLVEQLFPAKMWGTTFVSVPLRTRSKGDTFRFLALFNNTTVTTNGVPIPHAINQGRFIEVQLATGTQINSDKPILVAQYANSSDFDNVKNADPFMVLIPPIGLFGSSYVVQTPTVDFTGNFINIMAPAAAVGQVRVDGAVIPAAQFSPIGASGFSGAQVSVAT